MEVRIESEVPMGRDPQKSKLRRPNGPPVPSPAAVADQTGRVLSEREPEWLERLVSDPASFAAIEREVHARAAAGRPVRRRSPGQSERASGDGATRGPGGRSRRGPSPPGRKKRRPVIVRLLGGLAITVMTLYCSPRGRSGKNGRGPEGGGLYPELAAYRISEGSSPKVQAEVGRLVGLLPIAAARAELTRRGLVLDEKAVRRIASELGAQMLATRTRDLLRFRRGGLPAGTQLADERVAVQIDGGRVRVRTVVKKSRVGGKRKRRKFHIAWREPKVVIVYALDQQGRMARGSRPVIDGTLQGPAALIAMVACHLHRPGAARAREVVFVADGAPWIWARLDWVVARVGPNPLRVVEVRDWCHGAHHVSVALEALQGDTATRQAHYHRLRMLLKKGKSPHDAL